MPASMGRISPKRRCFNEARALWPGNARHFAIPQCSHYHRRFNEARALRPGNATSASGKTDKALFASMRPGR